MTDSELLMELPGACMGQFWVMPVPADGRRVWLLPSVSPTFELRERGHGTAGSCRGSRKRVVRRPGDGARRLGDHVGGGLRRMVGNLGQHAGVGIGSSDDAGVTEHLLDVTTSIRFPKRPPLLRPVTSKRSAVCASPNPKVIG
jgi:hypothetical protein